MTSDLERGNRASKINRVGTRLQSGQLKQWMPASATAGEKRKQGTATRTSQQAWCKAPSNSYTATENS